MAGAGTETKPGDTAAAATASGDEKGGTTDTALGDKLCLATRNNDMSGIGAICKSGAARLRDSSGHTALHWAALGTASSTLLYLLKHSGHPVDVRSTAPEQMGQTALHWAIVSGASTNVGILLKYGAKPSCRDARGYTTLIHCAQYGRVDLAHILLLSDPTLIDAVDKEGRSALHWASHAGHYPMVIYLLKVTRDVADVECVDYGGQSALHKASARNHLMVVKGLLRNGAQYSLKDNEGRTAIDLVPPVRGSHRLNEELKLAEKCETFKSPRSRIRGYGLILFYYVILVLSYWFYAAYIEWNNGDGRSAMLKGRLLRVFAMLSLVFHALASYGDAGDVEKGTPESARRDIEDAIANNRGDVALGPTRYCFTCLRARMARSKHSKTREVCVKRFDHECPWTNNAVGLRNHRVLLLFVVCMFVTQMIFLNGLTTALMNDPAVGKFWEVFSKRPLAAFLYFVHGFLSIFCVVLLAQHIRLAAKGSTTYESMAYKRLGYARNPHDRGFRRNCFFFITGTGPGTNDILITDSASTAVAPMEDGNNNSNSNSNGRVGDSDAMNETTARTELHSVVVDNNEGLSNEIRERGEEERILLS